MYAMGMTTSDIKTHIRDIYELDMSNITITQITDKILPFVRESAMMDIAKKWTGRRIDWSTIHAQLAILYEDRMPE